MAWVNLGNMKGPKGDKGDTGPQGPKGDTGASGVAASASGYVKMADGTLIVYFDKIPMAFQAANSMRSATVTFPVPFVNTTYSQSYSLSEMAFPLANKTKQIYTRLQYAGSVAIATTGDGYLDTETFDISAVFIGRWK